MNVIRTLELQKHMLITWSEVNLCVKLISFIPYISCVNALMNDFQINSFISSLISSPFCGTCNRSSGHSSDICCSQAIHVKVNPLYFMIPATVGCSYAFMLPVSTPPNSIAFASGHLMVKDMVSNATKDSLRKLDPQITIGILASCFNWSCRNIILL